MARQARAVDYNFESQPPGVTGEPGGSAHAAAPRIAPRPADAGAVPEFLQLLARAIQQFHTYPATSPICRGAIDTALRALSGVARDRLVFRVSPHEILADEVPFGRGTIIENELARRLHAAAIAQVTIEAAVSARELTHLAVDLLACSGRVGPDTGLIELLAEHGVDRIELRPAYRPEVLPVQAPAPPVADLIAFQRERRDQAFAGGGHVDHLYPPDKAWVRIDPAAALPSVSLMDLALLTGDPAALAGMLVRLTDDEAGDGGTEEALSQKFSDVSLIFSALEPRVARIMFSKLARAVLDLDTERRQALLRRTILPSLLDGRIDGTVLRDFPDVDLAESLCLLLDLETAAPEVVTTALARLDLPAEREAAVIPLLEQRLQARAEAARPESLGLDAHARRLVRLDPDRSRSFAEFAAFDLSLDEEAARTLVTIRQAIEATDIVIDRIACLWRLVRLEPNPETVQRLLARAAPLLADLQRHERWADLADWLSRCRELAESLREARPDVADAIAAQLAAFCTPDLAHTLVTLAGGGDAGRAAANRIVAAIGAGIGEALLRALPAGDGRDAGSRAAVQVLCDHAGLVAPALAPLAGRIDPALSRVVARVLGLAGAGYEPALAALLESPDQQTVRETLRALARIGTPRAAALVSAQVQTRRDWVASAAEQSLWHFPPAEAQREVRALLARRDFMLQQPAVAARLLDRTVQAGVDGLEPVLRSAISLQYRFWNPPQMRLGRKARAILNR